MSSEGEKCGKQLRPHVAIINQARTNPETKTQNQKPHKPNYPITSKKFWVPRFKTGSKGEVLSSEGEKCGKQLRPHVAIINQARTNTAEKSNFQ